MITRVRSVGPLYEGPAVLLVAQAAYHLEELIPVRDELRLRGIAVNLVVPELDWKPLHRFRPAVRRNLILKEACPDELAVPRSAADLAQQSSAVVVMNDWGTTAQIVSAARSSGVPVVAIVEGVQDFDDLDVERERKAYRSSDHVICLGPYDYAQLNGIDRSVGGSSRFQKAWDSPTVQPTKGLITVNSNFTYGVLAKERRKWVAGVRQAVLEADQAMVLSRHPAERGLGLFNDHSNERISTLLHSSTRLISRFSTVCLDALLVGIPLVYHNPHGEKVRTFAESLGAFSTTTSVAQLAAILRSEEPTRNEARITAKPFLTDHLLLDGSRTPAEHVADVLLDNFI